MTAPIRVGLAGLGAMGRNHMRHLSTRGGCVLAAVADPNLVAARDLAARCGVARAVADPEEVLGDPAASGSAVDDQARARAWSILSQALFCSTSFQYLD